MILSRISSKYGAMGEGTDLRVTHNSTQATNKHKLRNDWIKVKKSEKVDLIEISE